MLTKTDYDELERRFVTVDKFDTTITNLGREIIEVIGDFREEIMKEIKELRTELKDEIRELRTEMNEFRVEVRMGVVNHEKRINKLEEKNYA